MKGGWKKEEEDRDEAALSVAATSSIDDTNDRADVPHEDVAIGHGASRASSCGTRRRKIGKYFRDFS
jgi:hypothetical protein